MKPHVAIWPLMLLWGLVLSGCQPTPTDPPVPSPPPVAPVPPPPPVAPVAVAPAPPPPTEQIKADVGVGSKGRSLDTHSGLLVEPAKQYFALKERIVFQIQIPENMKLFKALEGRAPQSHEEFMEKIIQEGQIKLPPLPPGNVYVYDPATEELMVQRPKPATP